MNPDEDNDYIPEMPEDYGREFKDSPLYTPIDEMSDEDLAAADKELAS